LVRQDRATINSGSPPSCGANFCSDRWLHRPRWVGWLVRYLDVSKVSIYSMSMKLTNENLRKILGILKLWTYDKVTTNLGKT